MLVILAMVIGSTAQATTWTINNTACSTTNITPTADACFGFVDGNIYGNKGVDVNNDTFGTDSGLFGYDDWQVIQGDGNVNGGTTGMFDVVANTYTMVAVLLKGSSEWAAYRLDGGFSGKLSYDMGNGHGLSNYLVVGRLPGVPLPASALLLLGGLGSIRRNARPPQGLTFGRHKRDRFRNGPSAGPFSFCVGIAQAIDAICCGRAWAFNDQAFGKIGRAPTRGFSRGEEQQIMTKPAFKVRLAVLAAGAMALASCSGEGGGVLRGVDIDLRGSAGALDTSDAAQNATTTAPQPDARGIISYPGYQVAVARRGDTVRTVATRIGVPVEDLARHNVLPDTVVLREGEVLALPYRVSEPLNAGGTDIASIAGTAIDRADGGSGVPGLPAGGEPTRHRVAPGETAFSIARLYDVPVASLAEWNGLGSDLALRVGQTLLIPIRTAAPSTEPQEIQVAAVASPGQGTPTPLPPSASEPLPREDVKPVAVKPRPQAQPLEDKQTEVSDTSRLRMPVQGRIIRTFAKGKNEGIGIAADAGDEVVAADAGTVAAITRDTDQVPILVIRHEGNLLTVYAGVDEIEVEKGDKVERGEQIAVVRAANPPFLHFEVREGFDSVDPTPYLN